MTFDPDFGKRGFARDLFRIRFRRLHLSQTAFAQRFGLSFGQVKDQEQGRAKPTAAFRTLVVAIELDPELIEKAATIAKTRWPQDVLLSRNFHKP